MNVLSDADSKKRTTQQQIQITKCLNEKRRREQENVFFEELAELITPDMNSASSPLATAAIKPDKCAILQETVNQVRRIKQGSAEHPATPSTDELQRSEVSSSKPTILGNNILGPLLLEALGGFMFMVNAESKIEFVSTNVVSFLRFTQDDLIDKSIYNFLHVGDHNRFSTIFFPLSLGHSLNYSSSGEAGNGAPTNGTAGAAAKGRSINCRFLLKDVDGVERYEMMQVSAVTLPPPGDVLEGEVRLVCMARRIPLGEDSPASASGLEVEQFSTKLDLTGKILKIDTNGMSATYSQYLNKELVGCAIQELCHPKDINKLNLHLKEAIQTGSNTSSFYRFRIGQDRYVPLQSRTTYFSYGPSNTQEVLMATHSIVKDVEECDTTNSSSSMTSTPTSGLLSHLDLNASSAASLTPGTTTTTSAAGMTVGSGGGGSHVFSNSVDCSDLLGSWDTASPHDVVYGFSPLDAGGATGGSLFKEEPEPDSDHAATTTAPQSLHSLLSPISGAEEEDSRHSHLARQNPSRGSVTSPPTDLLDQQVGGSRKSKLRDDDDSSPVPSFKRSKSHNAAPTDHLAGQNPMLSMMLSQTPSTPPASVPASIATSIMSQLPQDRLPRDLEKKLLHTPCPTSSSSSMVPTSSVTSDHISSTSDLSEILEQVWSLEDDLRKKKSTAVESYRLLPPTNELDAAEPQDLINRIQQQLMSFEANNAISTSQQQQHHQTHPSPMAGYMGNPPMGNFKPAAPPPCHLPVQQPPSLPISRPVGDLDFQTTAQMRLVQQRMLARQQHQLRLQQQQQHQMASADPLSPYLDAPVVPSGVQRSLSLPAEPTYGRGGAPVAPYPQQPPQQQPGMYPQAPALNSYNQSVYPAQNVRPTGYPWLQQQQQQQQAQPPSMLQQNEYPIQGPGSRYAGAMVRRAAYRPQPPPMVQPTLSDQFLGTPSGYGPSVAGGLVQPRGGQQRGGGGSNSLAQFAQDPHAPAQPPPNANYGYSPNPMDYLASPTDGSLLPDGRNANPFGQVNGNPRPSPPDFLCTDFLASPSAPVHRSLSQGAPTSLNQDDFDAIGLSLDLEAGTGPLECHLPISQVEEVKRPDQKKSLLQQLLSEPP